MKQKRPPCECSFCDGQAQLRRVKADDMLTDAQRKALVGVLRRQVKDAGKCMRKKLKEGLGHA